MSLELSESGMGLDLCAKFGEFSPMGSMTSLEEEEEDYSCCAAMGRVRANFAQLTVRQIN